MKKSIIFITILFTQISSNCQNVYDKEKIFKFDGIEFKTKVLVNDSNSEIKVITYSKKNSDSIKTNIFKFDDLFFQNKIRIFNNIIFLQDGQGIYYYNFLDEKKYYTQIGNRYNEDLRIGIYNPILEKNILKILNYKLDVIDIIDINKYLKYGESWDLSSNSDVKNGKIELIKFVPSKEGYGKYKYVGYIYDVKSKKITIK
jgi:hypothetical protein